jgi:hypothetical protein
MSGRELLLEAVAHQEITPVSLPDHPKVDGKIFVRVLNAGERHLFGSVSAEAKDAGGISDYEIVAICACEADGTPMFHSRDDAGRITINTEDVNRLREVDGRITHAVALKALDMSGLLAGAKTAAKKGLPSDPSDASSSGSPSSSDAPSENSSPG